LREGLENILRARTGGLVVVSSKSELLKLAKGGFAIDSEVSPAALYELAKMDGAIVITADCKRIILANAELVPSPDIPSQETGIRHRTAERVARETDELVIAISQRRQLITLYFGPYRYVLRDTTVIMSRANQGLQTLERYKQVLDEDLRGLTRLELDGMVVWGEVFNAIQRAELVTRMADEIDRYIIELGVEGRLTRMQLVEMTGGLVPEYFDLIRDYQRLEDNRPVTEVKEEIARLSPEALTDPASLARVFGLNPNPNLYETLAVPRGYRVLGKIPRLPGVLTARLVATFDALPAILAAEPNQLYEVDGIGEVRAKAIKNGLNRLKLATADR
jgi:diadenylate cyclase